MNMINDLEMDGMSQEEIDDWFAKVMWAAADYHLRKRCFTLAPADSFPHGFAYRSKLKLTVGIE